MSPKRLGWSLSIIWFLFLAFIVYVNNDRVGNLTVNELGDFFAGFIAPLALIWLVLGYFQQGVELRQNSAALRLQAEELKHLVTQNEKLVEQNKRHADLTEKDMANKLKTLKEDQEPLFTVEMAKSTNTVGSSSIWRIEFINRGGKASNLWAETGDPRLTNIEFLPQSAMESEQKGVLTIELSENLHAPAEFKYGYKNISGDEKKFRTNFHSNQKIYKEIFAAAKQF